MTPEERETTLETMEIAVNIWNDRDLSDDDRKELLDAMLNYTETTTC